MSGLLAGLMRAPVRALLLLALWMSAVPALAQADAPAGRGSQAAYAAPAALLSVAAVEVRQALGAECPDDLDSSGPPLASAPAGGVTAPIRFQRYQRPPSHAPPGSRSLHSYQARAPPGA